MSAPRLIEGRPVVSGACCCCLSEVDGNAGSGLTGEREPLRASATSLALSMPSLPPPADRRPLAVAAGRGDGSEAAGMTTSRTRNLSIGPGMGVCVRARCEFLARPRTQTTAVCHTQSYFPGPHVCLLSFLPRRSSFREKHAHARTHTHTHTHTHTRTHTHAHPPAMDGEGLPAPQPPSTAAGVTASVAVTAGGGAPAALLPAKDGGGAPSPAPTQDGVTVRGGWPEAIGQGGIRGTGRAPHPLTRVVEFTTILSPPKHRTSAQPTPTHHTHSPPPCPRARPPSERASPWGGGCRSRRTRSWRRATCIAR